MEITPPEYSKGDTFSDESSNLASNNFTYRPTTDCDHHSRRYHGAGPSRSQYYYDGCSDWSSSSRTSRRSSGRTSGWASRWRRSLYFEFYSDTASNIVPSQLHRLHRSRHGSLSSSSAAVPTNCSLAADRICSRYHYRVVPGYRGQPKSSRIY